MCSFLITILIKSTRQCLAYFYCIQTMSIMFAGVCINVSSNNLVYRLRGSIRDHLSQSDTWPRHHQYPATVCCLSVHCFLKKLRLGFCNGLALGCSSGRFLKAIQLERLRLSSYWHNRKLKKKRKHLTLKQFILKEKKIIILYPVEILI